jgi:hypothetical protein
MKNIQISKVRKAVEQTFERFLDNVRPHVKIPWEGGAIAQHLTTRKRCLDENGEPACSLKIKLSRDTPW